MRSRIAIVICSIILTATLYAGEKPSIHLTGNPSIDFFSTVQKNNLAGTSDADSISPVELVALTSSKKSPWIAGLLSLAVPGAGEVYTENYLKGAIFFAIEAASWTTVYIYDKKGDRQTDVFMDYANAHWSAARYARWLQTNFPAETSQFNLFYGSMTDCDPPFSCVNWTAVDSARLSADAGGSGRGLGHALPFWGQQQYYELIGKYPQFSKGWDSQEGTDPSNYKDGNPQFDAYRAMFNQADKYYDVASSFVSVVVVNHILSAIDAAWSATRYNSALHAEVRMNMVPTTRGFMARTEAKIKYTF